jgi:hypothetical protein
VLGRALLAARSDANSFWMLLSGNPEVALSSTRTATTTPAANLPTPATTNAVTPANVAPSVTPAAAVATAAVTASASRVASTAVNDTSASASQKRKACP